MRRLRSLGMVVLLALTGASALVASGPGASGSGLIVYVGPSSPPSLFVTNPTSGATTRLTHGSDGDPAWSPDGRRIAFVRSATAELYSSSMRVFVMNADGSGVRPVTRRMPVIISPDWSPDGKQIAFTAPGGGGRAIHVVDVDGSGLRRLTADFQRVFDLSWSSSDLIAVTSWGQPGMGIWALRPDGTRLHRVTLGPALWPAWSPDGTKIAYERQPEGLFVIRAGGNRRAGLTGKTAGYHHPTWSPNGTRIAYVAGAKQHYLWLMNADGSHRQRLVRTTQLKGATGTMASPDWQPIPR